MGRPWGHCGMSARPLALWLVRRYTDAQLDRRLWVGAALVAVGAGGLAAWGLS